MSKGLKQENIVRKGKAGRKAFKKPEEKKPEAPKPKPKAAPPKPKAKPKPAPKKKVQKKKAPPKITKVAPVGPGQKPKDKTNISAGNILPRKSKRKTKPKENVTQTYIAQAQEAKHIFEDSLQEVIAALGPLPPGVKWEDI